MNILHPDYSNLAARVSVSRIHKTTKSSLKDYSTFIYHFVDRAGRDCNLLSDEAYGVFQKHHVELDAMMDYQRDMDYDFFGLKTLERAYLLRVNGVIAERPQQMLMRVCVGIHVDNMEKIKQSYDLLSNRWFTHATPTLFNAGTPKP